LKNHQFDNQGHSRSVLSRKNNNSVFAQQKASLNLMRGIRAGGPTDQRSSGFNSSLERVDKLDKGAGSYQTT
jgi:hypothetical protein